MDTCNCPFQHVSSALLFTSVALPLVCAALLYLGSVPRAVAKIMAAIGFTVPLVLALYLCTEYASSLKISGYAFYSDASFTGFTAAGISLKLGLNGISLPLFVMAAIVSFAAGIYAMAGNQERQQLYLALLLTMSGGVLGLFASIDIFFFYFFHELALIPTFIMIGIWGGASRRIAAIEMTIYLTVGAMLVLAGMVALYVGSGLSTFDFITLRDYLAANPLSAGMQKWVYGLLLIGFGILVSLFPFHTWAPRGYANAPASTAMLHAGVLKKFGLYGLIQMMAPLLPLGAGEWTNLLVVLALGNVLVIGFITMAQKDLRYMLGYSSVMHMGYAFLGIATMGIIGIGGAVMMMFAHGLAVAALFLMADCVDKRGGTTDMASFGGMAKETPILAALFAAATFASVGLPGFANFWGELSIFTAVFNMNKWVGALAILGIIISAIYGLRAMASVFFGKRSAAYEKRILTTGLPQDLTFAEKLPVLVLLGSLMFVGFWPRSIGDNLNAELAVKYPPAPVQQVENATASLPAADDAALTGERKF
ncbi:MAG TPA: NADH-quinone oxidoreductase subunit M [Opitutales bacterium]|nr:NADH-quinone oxidoreductase subunit M [Opitutales bacterium]